ncbi:diacylglycerol kinase family lipid kinase [Chelativorans sp. ZYF759]|uniref:diacylglycerol/lipid kinase family protein n=1 Tax=Chelativorans sp. ZYF759 TaxID=2692213 RepID=UPI00145F58FD|nr:diacylglycerol kinase family protein [Chelativorans sp. ZYF759]NMG38294.1 diacylglycerol kinase family lipid kinase [Chelativorans sp. ZYF759]
MRFVVLINREGGSFKTTDLDDFSSRLEEIMQAAGHELEICIVEGREIDKKLKSLTQRADCDALVVGGGDGTVSAAAGAMMNSDKLLGILPGGTMNLFARSLGLPLDIEEAAEVFARGFARKVDIATANGRPFVHQFSLGMHPKLVKLRDEAAFQSRFGKLRASTVAAIRTLFDPPSLTAKLTLQADELHLRTPSLGISNNLFGEGHLPFADRPDGGTLGVYIARVRERRDLFRFAADMLLGRWQSAPEIDVRETRQARLEIAPVSRALECTIDGELIDLETVTEFEIHPGALTVLVAPPSEDHSAA